MMSRRRSVPAYQLHKSSGHARVRINGRDHFLGKYNSPESIERYQRLVAEMVASNAGAEAKVEAREGITIAEMLLAYMRHAEDYYRHSRELENIKKALRTLRRLYAGTRVVEFGPRSLKNVRQSMIDAGLCRIQINKRIRSIVRVFRWAAGEELIPASVPHALQQVEGLRRGFTEARESRPIQPVLDSDVEATLECLPAIPADMVRLQRLTGARPSEICILRPADVDRSGKIWEYRPLAHKGTNLGRDRVIYLGPRARAVLRPYLLRPADSYCFSPTETVEQLRRVRHLQRSTPISRGNRPGTNRKRYPTRTAGARYSIDSYRRAIRRACDQAEVPRWSPNQLRHSAATEIRQRFGLEAAQVTLGHASADVTQVYAERDQALARRVAQEVG